MNGKGDKRRPMNVPNEEFEKNFDLIFKKKRKKNADKAKTKPEDKG